MSRGRSGGAGRVMCPAAGPVMGRRTATAGAVTPCDLRFFPLSPRASGCGQSCCSEVEKAGLPAVGERRPGCGGGSVSVLGGGRNWAPCSIGTGRWAAGGSMSSGAAGDVKTGSPGGRCSVIGPVCQLKSLRRVDVPLPGTSARGRGAP